MNFSKIGKGSKFAVERDWKSKISQNVQLLGFFFKKIDGFLEKIWLIFLKSVKIANLPYKWDWNSEFSRKVQHLGFSKKNRWVFRKKWYYFLKMFFFRPNYEIFWIKNFWMLEKLEIMM